MSPLAHNRFVCIHGHFYQPPRENPFTGAIPLEAGAEPYNNYNEKINAECYRPNAELGNFRRIGFDMGPTLTNWLAQHDPATLRRIAAADRYSLRHHGAGPALAQGYHHTILPLDSQRDRQTQVRWGVRDFQFRFGRTPLGLWLPETAVDLATLTTLANEGIAFTILAPWQATGPVVPGQPYQVQLPGGRTIVVFFYDAELSSLISFQPEVTVSAPRFVQEQLLPRLAEPVGSPRLILVASDGELYGHHQSFRDLFLQDLVGHRLAPAGLQAIALEGFLRLVPERPLSGIRDRTSWSCHHGVERWYTSCDCIAGHDGHWKLGLRSTLDWLRDRLDAITEEATAGLLHDVWAARDDYIEVVLGTTGATGWLVRHLVHEPTTAQRQRLGAVMQAQRYRMAMYASCAFFWEDLARIEPRNAIANGLMALRLIENVTDHRLEFDFLHRLEQVISPRTRQTAAEIVRPLAVAD